MKKQTAWTLIFLVSFFSELKSQNFSYSFQKDSSEYVALSSPIGLLYNENFADKHPVIHLPFSFNFCGAETDSVVVETNGFLIFNKPKSLSAVAFNNFSGNKDSLGYYPATLSYKMDGSLGNRVVKIEFRNFSINMHRYFDNLNYQVWLYENGDVIEYRIGPSYYSTLPGYELPALIGAINQNMDSENKAFLVAGNPASPSGQLISGENELQYISTIPSSGIIYRLTPSF